MRTAFIGLAVLVLAGAGWWYFAPQTPTQPAPVFNVSDPTNFNEVGVLHFRPAQGQAEGTFEYQDDTGTTTKRLILDEFSVCAAPTGALPCMAMSVSFDIAFDGKQALVEGELVGDALFVRKLRIAQEGEELRSFELGNAFITWPTAVQLLETCQVTMAMQAHSLDVTLTLKDGRKVTAVEPTIDEMFKVINRTQAQCGTFPVATE